MKLVDTKDAVGTVLCHDITQIIKGVRTDLIPEKAVVNAEGRKRKNNS